MTRALAIAGLIALCCGCLKPPDYSTTPAITFKALSKSTVKQNTDTLQIILGFTDGDGDLGPASTKDTTLDVFVTDSRDQSVQKFQLPNLTPGGNVKAISGDVMLSVGSFACRAGFTNDQLTYSIQVKDRAGHLSNAVQTTPITIDCQ